MSFSDLMSSGRGPGVIGMLIALFVLIGFGTLFMFAFDEGTMGGDKSLVAMIRDADKEIITGKARIEDGGNTLATIPALRKTAADLLEAKAKKEFLTTRITQRVSEIKEINTGIDSLEEEFADYKNQYRVFVRNNASGTKLEELKTFSGEVYTDVDIRKVTAVGIEIRHRDGHKRIGFEDLPEEMQDFYQFDKAQMLAEVQREAVVRKQHNAAVALSDQAVKEQTAMQKVRDREQASQKAMTLLAAKESRLAIIGQELQNLQSELSSSESAAQAARASGRMHLSKSGGIRSRIASKNAEQSRVQGEIASLRASL